MTKRDRLMLTAVLAIALLGGFWMFVLSPQRKAAADAAAQVTQAEDALNVARSKVTSGQRAQQSFRKDRTTIVRLGRVVPETDDVPTLLTQLQALATKEKVDFLTYQVEATNSGGGSTSDATDTKKSSTSTGAQEGRGSTAAVAPLFPPGTVEIDGGLGRTPITLEFEGTYFRLERYLRAVQRFAVLSQKRSRTNGRLMIVDAISYESASGDNTATTKKGELPDRWQKQPQLRAKLSASVYFAPPLDAPSAKAAGGSASSAAGGSTASPSGSSSTGTAAIGGVQ